MKIVLAAINAKYIHANLAIYSLRAFSDEYKEQIQIKEYDQPVYGRYTGGSL